MHKKNYSIFILLTLTLVGCSIQRLRGVEVAVTNVGHTPIRQLALSYTGGVVRVHELAGGATYGVMIKPTGDSHIEVEFVDSAGVRHKEKVDVYFVKYDQGKITINIDAAGKVSWIDEIK